MLTYNVGAVEPNGHVLVEKVGSYDIWRTPKGRHNVYMPTPTGYTNVKSNLRSLDAALTYAESLSEGRGGLYSLDRYQRDPGISGRSAFSPGQQEVLGSMGVSERDVITGDLSPKQMLEVESGLRQHELMTQAERSVRSEASEMSRDIYEMRNPKPSNFYVKAKDGTLLRDDSGSLILTEEGRIYERGHQQAAFDDVAESLGNRALKKLRDTRATSKGFYPAGTRHYGSYRSLHDDPERTVWISDAGRYHFEQKYPVSVKVPNISEERLQQMIEQEGGVVPRDITYQRVLPGFEREKD